MTSEEQQQVTGIRLVSLVEIKIGNRFRKDLGDIQALAESIKQNGLLQPIVLSETFELIAGQRRLEAVKLLGWFDIPAHIVNLDNIIQGEFEENYSRKDFTPSEMVAIKRALEPIEKTKAQERQQSGQPAAESDKGRVDDRISAAIGISRDTLRKPEAIVEAAEKEPEKYREIARKVDSGELSINAGYQQVSIKD